MKKSNKFYVYLLLDPRNPGDYKYGKYEFDFEPFYVGKGCGTRMYQHYCLSELKRCRNPHEIRKIKKILAAGLKPIPMKIKNCLLENIALNLEKKIIKAIGRRNLRNGPLTNMDEGGRVGPKMTKKLKEKISKILKRKYKNGEITHPWIGRKHSIETKLKISMTSRMSQKPQKKQSKKTKIKIGLSNSCAKANLCNSYLFLSPLGIKTIVDRGLKRFSKEIGIKLGIIKTLIRGEKTKNKSNMGWRFIKILKHTNTGIEKAYVLISPNGKNIVVKNGLRKFCIKRGLQYTNLIKVAKGLRFQHKGWKCKFV